MHNHFAKPKNLSGRRKFLADFGKISGGTLLLNGFGCGRPSGSQTLAIENAGQTELSTLTTPLASTSTSPYSADKLLQDIASARKEVLVPEGTWVIDFTNRSSVISNCDSRKLIGDGRLGAVKIVFTNVPDNFVCLDFQDKGRIRNISFEVKTRSDAGAKNVTMVQFKKKITSYKEAGRIAIEHPSEPQSPSSIKYLLDIERQIEAGVIQTTRDSSNNITSFTFDGKTYDAGSSPIYLVMTYLANYECSIYDSNIRPVVWRVSGDRFVPYLAGDEADMDSSFSNCSFAAIGTNDGMPARGITAVAYVGRNLACKDCAFEGVGTGINLSFPRALDLSDPSSFEVRNQGAFYGHRKGRIFRSTFKNVPRALHLSGPVTVRGLMITENSVFGGQLIFCDGEGGMRGCIVSQNKVSDHNDLDFDYDSTILFKNGFLDDNTIVDNTFSGSTRRFLYFTDSANKCQGNIIAQNTFLGSSVCAVHLSRDKHGQSVLISNNRFGSYSKSKSTAVTSPPTVILLGLRKNQSVTFNSLDYPQSQRVFVELQGVGNTRLMVTRNTKVNPNGQFVIVKGEYDTDPLSSVVQEVI